MMGAFTHILWAWDTEYYVLAVLGASFKQVALIAQPCAGT